METEIPTPPEGYTPVTGEAIPPSKRRDAFKVVDGLLLRVPSEEPILADGIYFTPNPPIPPVGHVLVEGPHLQSTPFTSRVLVWSGRFGWMPTGSTVDDCGRQLGVWYAVPTPTPSISEEAAAVVAGDRADDYGDVNESFARTAKLWSAYTGTTISPWDVAQMMILLKVSRAKTSTKRDTLVDIAGYAECAGQLKQAD